MSEKEPKSNPASQDQDAKITSLEEHWERFVRLRVEQGHPEADTRELRKPYYSGAAVAHTLLAKLREEGVHARFMALHAEIRRYTDSPEAGANVTGPEEYWEAYVRLRVRDGEPEAVVQMRKAAYYAGAAMVFAIMMNANDENYSSLVQSMLNEINGCITAAELEQFGTPINIQIA
jgi:hypothetical protein